jgi:hypothetical protein
MEPLGCRGRIGYLAQRRTFVVQSPAEETLMKNRLKVPAGATAPACASTASPAREQPMQGLLLAGCPDF